MKYKAFLSYKHPDKAREMEFVKRFEASLKNYAKPFLTPPIKIFRDEVSLAPGADLNQMIRDALAESEYLILLASEDASKSKWVDAEIKVWFEDLKRTDEKLIVVVLDGQIDMKANQEIDWAKTTCLPKSAETYLKTIPLWIDFRELAQVEDIDLGHPVFKAGINGIVARFRDLNPEAMIGQEILQHRRNRQIAYGVGAALGLLLIATVSFATISVSQRQQATLAQAQSGSRQLAAQSVFSRRHQADQLTRSALLAAESVRMWPTLQGSDALLAAVSLLRPELHHVDHAAPVLGLSFDATGKHLASVSASSDGGSIKVMDTESYDLVFEREHDTGFNLVEFSPSSEFFVVAGWSNNVQAFETETGALKFEIARNQNEGTSRIESVAFSQDGNFLAVGAGDEITLHSPSTGQRITSLSLDGLVEHFEFSPSSEQLIAASGDSVTIWSLTDNPTSVVLPHENSVNSVSLGPNGRFAASGDIDGVIKLWDLESNSVHGQWQLEEEVVEVKFSPNGWWLGAATGDPFSFSGQVKFWSVDDLIERGSKRHQGPVTAIEFSPDSRSIASSSLDNTARIWDVFSAHELARVTHENALISLAISPRGHFLATGAHDHRAKLWSIKDAALLRLPHASEVTAVAISNDGKYISTGSQGLGVPGFNGLVRLWETETGKLLFGKSYESGVAKVAFNSKGTEIAAVSEGGGSVLVWGVPSGDLVAKFEHAEDVIDFAFLPGSDAVVTIDGSGLLSLWMLNGERPEYVQPTGNSGSHIELSSDGRWIAVPENNFVRILRASTGEEIGRIDLENAAQFARFSPDDARLAVIETPGTLSLWQTSDWRRLSTVKTDDTIVEVLFSADGRRVVTRSDHEQVLANIWRVDPLERMSALPHDAPVMSIDVSHNGHWVATGSVDNTARVWDLETGEELARMDFDHLVADVAFSDDGHRIVAGSHDKSAVSWRWQSLELIASACERLPRNLTAEEWRHFLPDQEYNATCPLP